MSQHTAALLAKLKGQRTTSVLPRLRSLLKSPEGRVIANSSVHPTASILEPIWRVRLQIAQTNGNKIDGLAELLPRLQSLPADQPVQQFGVAGAEDAGNVFFNAETGELLGAVLVVMSEHTRAYFRGELTGSPIGPHLDQRKPAAAVLRRSVKQKKAMA